MSPHARWKLGVALLVLTATVLLPGRVSIWIDEHGRATLSNRPGGPGGDAVELSPEDLRMRWQGDLSGEPISDSDSDSSSDHDRFTRELLAARDDLRRGELREGLGRLRRLHRDYPHRPEPAWLLAQVERRRGRLQPARQALDAALTRAAAMPAEWRGEAERLRAEIDAELAHAGGAYEGGPINVRATTHFRVSYDHQFAGRQFGEQTLEMLERARERIESSLGRSLQRNLEVRLYTRAQYLESYEHRFGFATVGFYDGAIHVVSARHPRDELYALLIHEYAHAVFADALGGHEPFFINEGIADGEEERARGRPELSRGEWRRLLDALRGKTWIRLGSLVRGFGGLEGDRLHVTAA